MVILYIHLTGPFSFFLGTSMFFCLGFGALWAVVKAFRFHIIRIKVQRLVEKRNLLFNWNDESYKDIQREIDRLTCNLDKTSKKILNEWLARKINV